MNKEGSTTAVRFVFPASGIKELYIDGEVIINIPSCTKYRKQNSLKILKSAFSSSLEITVESNLQVVFELFHIIMETTALNISMLIISIILQPPVTKIQ